ncbi:ribosome hibernation-promoting factor, HPF/YfiA family [Lederbergia citrea]|uniref:Ribosome hibernation promoting factor n=1 Tax=Lederbergia citrea TaxID=2833581 RepID=A0A942UKL7_9BACI|nr:ribosome-associated translation inhibitor RaiA [Lederbergia citrea]MBS4178304.1 ribosome-associated translation inhibitor RaiA [Lederbergia citrea]MBS4204980.1 ribosome-associated translation inhibitor RaiA [Lederbergia citrea]MBS4223165.1 ribosome-associated translation inhibitor RaiA [Lederbergia citrea]
MLNYQIRGENIEVTEAIRDHVEKKVDKLERYFNETPEANVHVNLKVNPNKKAKVEITIPLPQLVLRAEEENDDMYAAVDLIVDKLERQIRKHKTKVNRKFREQGSAKEFFNTSTNGVAAAVEEDDDELNIVRTKRFDLKPMDSEEAVLQMNMLGHSFFIYTDAETDGTHIVYRRRDGKYGLIETN